MKRSVNEKDTPTAKKLHPISVSRFTVNKKAPKVHEGWPHANPKPLLGAMLEGPTQGTSCTDARVYDTSPLLPPHASWPLATRPSNESPFCPHPG